MNPELKTALDIQRHVTFTPLRFIDPGLTHLPIVAHGRGYQLQDRNGNRISWHRTMTGALRARRERLQEAQ